MDSKNSQNGDYTKIFLSIFLSILRSMIKPPFFIHYTTERGEVMSEQEKKVVEKLKDVQDSINIVNDNT